VILFIRDLIGRIVDPSEYNDQFIEDSLRGGVFPWPNSIIYLKNIDPITSNSSARDKSFLLHEVFHQYQYTRHGRQEAYCKLVEEIF
jgi:hypothetical protein